MQLEPSTNPDSSTPEPATQTQPAVQHGDTTTTSRSTDSDPAVNLIRRKLDAIYGNEPNAVEELVEAEQPGRHSKHQRYMLSLHNSGKSLADIQTTWHEYYAQLPDREKHEVWQEFYSQHGAVNGAGQTQENARSGMATATNPPPTIDKEQVASLAASQTTSRLAVVSWEQVEQGGNNSRSEPIVAQDFSSALQAKDLSSNKDSEKAEKPSEQRPEQTVSEVKKRLLRKVDQRSQRPATKRGKAKLKLSQHLKSLGFGLAAGGFFLLFILFGFFNERFITPFITPSRTVSATPIIVDPNGSQAVGAEAKVIIPKINIEAPVIYNSNTTRESDIEKILESGTYHYDTTAKPGEKGNVIIFGHSSNNIFNPGQFKFVFLDLHKLDIGDQFMLNYNGTRYTYRVFNKRVVNPDQVNILSESPHPTMATLVTCDPPGTSLKRLLIEADQITPDPGANIASTANTTIETPQTLPSNSPSLWHRLTSWF